MLLLEFIPKSFPLKLSLLQVKPRALLNHFIINCVKHLLYFVMNERKIFEISEHQNVALAINK